MIFKGVITALITPFQNDEIDYNALYKLMDKQIEAGIDALVVGGSTGEGSSLLEAEYYELIKFVIKHANKRIPIIAAVNAASTKSAVDKVKNLCSLDIDGIMCTAPHYIRPEQTGLILHYKAISEASSLPIMLYIHPGRTGCNFSDDTLLEIAKFEHIVSIKDATSDLEKPLRILQEAQGLSMLCGNDQSMLSYSANGGAGCVSVISNIFPKICKKINSLWGKGDIKSALELQIKLSPLFESIFIESNPIGIKYAASQMELCSNEIRLPLTPAVRIKEINLALKDLTIMENNA